MNFLKSIGGALLGITIFVASVVVLILFFKFGTTIAFNIAPFINTLAGILLIIDIAILLFAVIPKLRGVVGIIVYISSYVFGLSAWIYGLAVTLSLWGVVALIIGLLLGGVGVVPIGMLAAIFHGQWGIFFSLLITVLMTYGFRLIGKLLVSSSDRIRYENDNDIIEIDPEEDNKRNWKDLE